MPLSKDEPPACNTAIFGKLNKTQSDFKKFLDLPPLLSDGTRSNAWATTALCGTRFPILGCKPGIFETVAEFMVSESNASALAKTPSPTGPVIFVNPASVCIKGTAPGMLLNQAMLWHELLHNFTGLSDDDLITKLGITDSGTYGSTAISYYININVLGGNLHYFDPGGNAALICKE